nr:MULTISPECIES: hypothetical protein [Pseudomonas]
MEQAQIVAHFHANAPDLIIAWPFSRAQATALATMTIYPGAVFEP